MLQGAKSLTFSRTISVWPCSAQDLAVKLDGVEFFAGGHGSAKVAKNIGALGGAVKAFDLSRNLSETVSASAVFKLHHLHPETTKGLDLMTWTPPWV